MSTSYQIANAPKSAFGLIPNCAECDYEGLTSAVWLYSPETGLNAYGRGCAANLLGWSRTRTAPANFDRRTYEAQEAAKAAALRAEKAAYAARADGPEAFDTWEAARALVTTLTGV